MGVLSLTEVETIARRAHAGQVDKAGRPYAEHLAAVARGVRERGGSAEQIAAAWLHDAVEDDALSQEWLDAARLPEQVKAIVGALTKRSGEPQQDYAARILATPGALLVKQADLAHNADPVRLAALDERTAARLTAKYARMRGLLGLLGPAAVGPAAAVDPAAVDPAAVDPAAVEPGSPAG
ncbi:HD domain-containing protein [Kitasatospora sp. NBC_00315]|uniref:HD domain-containing protein n=1 Tax=Kitasatospora sp. NBC_00315 TaxID=2975963 RepID=UPI0032448419